MDEAKKAYTAAIIDGEGSISLTVHTTRKTKTGRPATAPKLVVQVANTSELLIDWLRQTWHAGTKTVSYRPKRPNHKLAYSWRLRGATAAKILREVMPYLVVKKPQAELGVHAQSLTRACRKLGDEEMACRMSLRDQMIALNGTQGRPGVLAAERLRTRTTFIG